MKVGDRIGRARNGVSALLIVVPALTPALTLVIY
jgi:hypothetical protein